MEADIGVILDPGAEYLFVVDEKGRLIPDSALLLVLLQQAAKEAGGGGTVVLPLHATKHAEHMITATGTNIRRAKCSKAALTAEATRPNTIFAASADGGYIYPAVLPSMDGLYALGKVLELISTSDAQLSTLVDRVPKAHMVHEVVDCPWDLKGVVMRRMTERLREGRVSLVDGIKVFLDHSEWVLILPDAEEPVFHVYAEAGDDARAAELAAGYLETLTAVIQEGGSA
jgi:mannose-1-phosphate guanylyltransferase/phosphomannomutase